jgi:hypothetical protein
MVLGLAGPAPGLGPADLPADAVVVVVALDVFDAPDDTSVASARLGRGDRVRVRDTERPGWLTIDPPQGSFCWVEESVLGLPDAGQCARVTGPGAPVRSGHPQTRIPGALRMELAQGSVVQLLSRPPLYLGEGGQRRTWRAIAPPQGDVRYIHADGVRIDIRQMRAGETESAPSPAPPAEIRTAYATPAAQPAATIAPDVAHALARIESVHRAALHAPIEQWNLTEVHKRYEDLLRGLTEPAAISAIRARLEEVARHEATARDARQIETLLARSRRRDASIALDERRLADAQTPQAQPYNMVGLIQPSSRRVEGRKVFALIGGDGTTQAYLDIPPGIDVRALMTHRVGVRGTVRFEELLRARVVSVREIETLDRERASLSGK